MSDIFVMDGEVRRKANSEELAKMGCDESTIAIVAAAEARHAAAKAAAEAAIALALENTSTDKDA